MLLRGLARLPFEPAESLVEFIHLCAAGNDRSCIDDAETRILCECGLPSCELGATCCQFRLRSRERRFRLVERGDPFLDVREALLGGLGRSSGSPGEVGFHPEQGMLPCGDVALTGLRSRAYAARPTWACSTASP